jgi:hypothetical protein
LSKGKTVRFDKMKTRNDLKLAAGLCALILYLPVAGQALTVEEFAAKYKAATSQQQRRDVCLSAIDDKVIRVGGSIASITAVCGNDFTSNHGTFKGHRLGIVWFKRNRGPIVGWRLAVLYNDEGKIVSFKLTDIS